MLSVRAHGTHFLLVLQFSVPGLLAAGCHLADSLDGYQSPGGLLDAASDAQRDSATSDDGNHGGLVNRNILARYFLSEASAGQEPATLRDATENAFGLTIDYSNSLTFTTDQTGRGVKWDQAGHNGRACRVLGPTTAIVQQLHNHSTATFEVVVSADAALEEGSTLITIEKNDSKSFELSVNVEGKIGVTWDQGQNTLLFPSNILRTGIAIVQATLDLDRGFPAIEVRIDGKSVMMDGTAIFQGDAKTFDIPSDAYLCIGNGALGKRSIEGTIYYAAVYNAVLTSDELKTNSERLRVDND